jgi:hypothetical protein
MARKVRYVAVRDCYYGPPGLRKLFRAGEYLIDGWEPGKHFVAEGEEPEEVEPAIQGPGDDPRSTRQMLKELEDKGIDMKGEARGAIFRKLIELEREEGITHTELAPPVEGDPLAGVKFYELSEDDVDRFTAKEITASITHRFNVDMSLRGKSKKQLVQLGLELEAKAVGARAE